MGRVLYLDCFSGISGDMVLGAFLDAGLPLQDLQGALGSLPGAPAQVSAARVLRGGVSATKFVVEGEHAPVTAGATHQHDHAHDHGHSHDHDHAREGVHTHEHTHSHSHASDHAQVGSGHRHDHGHRTLAEIYSLIDRSQLSAPGRERAKYLFQRLAEAEAAIHQTPMEKVHLHEVGALDSIVDIVGAVFAFEWAAVDRVVCSPLNVGGGTVHTAHGVLPVPAPATLKLLGGAPLYSGPVQKELVTPTGALLATSYASSFGSLPPMEVERVGYGAGDRDHVEAPNVLRLMIGTASAPSPGDRVVVIECEIDDMNPQLFAVAMERLYAAGALEVFYVPVQMKKNRPGTLLTVIAPPPLRTRLADIVFTETTTIGFRYQEMARECLTREIVEVQTRVGVVRVKVARRSGRVVNVVPEFEDCARLAASTGSSVKEVQRLALRAYGDGPSASEQS
jgi:uncharacterized protein (TIGR00299 family) protein